MDMMNKSGWSCALLILHIFVIFRSGKKRGLCLLGNVEKCRRRAKKEGARYLFTGMVRLEDLSLGVPDALGYLSREPAFAASTDL